MLFYLIAFCVQEFDARKKYKSFRKVFLKAAPIRKLDVIHKLLIQFNVKDPDHIISGINGKQKLVKKFRKNIGPYRKTIRRTDEKMKLYYRKIKAGCFQKYRRLKESELRKELSLDLRQDQLHNMRKMCKEVIYLSNLKKNAGLKSGNYDKLQKLIGDWHDKQLVLKILNPKSGNFESSVTKKLKRVATWDVKNIRNLLVEIRKNGDG